MQGLVQLQGDRVEGNAAINYFDILNFPEREGRPPKQDVEKVYPRIQAGILKEMAEANKARDRRKLQSLEQDARNLKEAHDFFTQEDPGNTLFNQWVKRRAARSRVKPSSRKPPGNPGTENIRISDPPLSADGEVFRGAAKGKVKAKKKVNFKPLNDIEFIGMDEEFEALESPSEQRNRRPGQRDHHSIPKDRHNGRIKPEIWERLKISPPPQEIQDAYARLPPLPSDELDFEDFAIEEPEDPSPSQPSFGSTSNLDQTAETELGNTENRLSRKYIASDEDRQMDKDLRRRLNAWNALREPGNLTKQQLLRRMEEGERNANRQIDLNAEVEAVDKAPRVPWQEIARQRALEAQTSYREQQRILFGARNKSDVADRLNRLELETPGWMKSAGYSFWVPGIVGPEYVGAKLLDDETNIDWKALNIEWPPPPTAEQIAWSERWLQGIDERIQSGELGSEDEEEEGEEEKLTSEDLQARAKETEPNTWWKRYQRSWVLKLLFGEHESLVDGRDIAVAPKQYRFKPSVYKLNDNLELEHVCSPGESYFEHLYFSNETFIWPESLPKPPGMSARDRWIMRLQETDALRHRDGLPPLDPIPGVTPTDLPYDPDLFNPPPKPQPTPTPSVRTGQVTSEPPPIEGRSRIQRPKIEDFIRDRGERGRQKNQNENQNQLNKTEHGNQGE
ncbi:hypothetical protein EYR41_001666 [Orbilia oligospora]|uniref:Uncharacterized protein n=1 Tax=Orbilia oligospora TaxID=2813651 RepID=A0A8H2EBT0_ORBOL|nr:hypothetical protein EYR41_001666 [Orbilia oligospora]